MFSIFENILAIQPNLKTRVETRGSRIEFPGAYPRMEGQPQVEIHTQFITGSVDSRTLEPTM